MQHPKFPVRRLLVKKSQKLDCWIAQSVDYDIVAQGKTKDELWKAFGHVYYGEIIVAMENNEPVHFRPAPQEAVVEWVNITERSTRTEQVPWSAFIPDWLPEAMGKLAKMYGASTPKDSVELATAAA